MTWHPVHVLAVLVIELSIVVGAWLSDARTTALVGAAAFVAVDGAVWLSIGRRTA